MREDFEKCVTRSADGISCNLGLWSVSGPDVERVECEALHYWFQYFRDGEYNALLRPSQAFPIPQSASESSRALKR
jgi:hypothetical protein